MSLSEVVKISNFYGADEEFVLAGGGNTSYKDSEFLYIKASGTTLATITQDGFVKMNRKKLNEIWEKIYSDNTEEREAQVLQDLMDSREQSELSKRPSVETTLHNLFCQSYVVHTHPAIANGLTCANDGFKYAKKIFGEDIIWIDATMPGYVLSKEVKDKLEEYENKTSKKADIVFLENHGIFVAADTIDEIKKLMDYVIGKLKENITVTPNFSDVAVEAETDYICTEIAKAIGSGAEKVIFFTNAEIARLTSDKRSFSEVNYAYTPDHMVYYKHTPLFCSDASDIEKDVLSFNQKHGFLPKLVAVSGVGAFATGSDEKQANIVKMLFLDAVKISVYAKNFGGGKYMPNWLVDFINNWEVEAYRKSISEK